MDGHKSKKRKIHRDGNSVPKNTTRNTEALDTSKPSATFTPEGPRLHTLSVALPGSIVSNAKSHDQKNFLAGSIARALAVFCVDEVIIYEDGQASSQHARTEPGQNDYTAIHHPSHFLAHIFSFLETPPYLRKFLFPMHPNLRTAGALPSLDMPHHPRSDEWCDYREGVVVSEDDESTAMIEVGLPTKIPLPGCAIPKNTRVTVKLSSRAHPELGAEAVDPAAPREATGYYWGFNVRRCESISAVITECPFNGGYDLCIGTSERGASISELFESKDKNGASSTAFPQYQHLLLVFGGVAGIEAAISADPELLGKGLTPETSSDLFDYWVNLLPNQGSRTIRTEEAVWLGLMGLRDLVVSNAGRSGVP